MEEITSLFKKDSKLINDYLDIILNLLSAESSNIVCFNSKYNKTLYKTFRKKLVKLGTMSIRGNKKLELLVFRNSGDRLLKMRINNQDILITCSQWLDEL